MASFILPEKLDRIQKELEELNDFERLDDNRCLSNKIIYKWNKGWVKKNLTNFCLVDSSASFESRIRV